MKRHKWSDVIQPMCIAVLLLLLSYYQAGVEKFLLAFASVLFGFAWFGYAAIILIESFVDHHARPSKPKHDWVELDRMDSSTIGYMVAKRLGIRPPLGAWDDDDRTTYSRYVCLNTHEIDDEIEDEIERRVEDHIENQRRREKAKDILIRAAQRAEAEDSEE